MVRYSELGYKTIEEYLSEFKSTLLKTTHTYDYFVDWNKVERKVKEHVIELSLLNSLVMTKDSLERKKLLEEILKQHPQLIRVIPLLLAVRDLDIEIAEFAEQVIYRRFNFSGQPLPSKTLEELVIFCEKTGILDLFGRIKDVYSYVLGTEVGLDTNARKNRSGELFKNVIDHLLTVTERELRGYGINFHHEREVDVQKLGIREQKKVDFLLSFDSKPLVACEVNVYNVAGSKPTEIIRSYIHINNVFKQSGIQLLWITDGPAWLDMWGSFVEGIESIDYVMNYTIACRVLKQLLISTSRSLRKMG